MKKLLLLATMVSTAGAHAQTVDTLASRELQEVVVSGVRAQKNAPFAVTNIKKTELDRFSKSGRELPFLFAHTPGIFAWGEMVSERVLLQCAFVVQQAVESILHSTEYRSIRLKTKLFFGQT